MKDFNSLPYSVVERWKVIYRYDVDCHEIKHIQDVDFFVYVHARNMGFIELVDILNEGDDYKYTLSEDGKAFIEFLLL